MGPKTNPKTSESAAAVKSVYDIAMIKFNDITIPQLSYDKLMDRGVFQVYEKKMLNVVAFKFPKLVSVITKGVYSVKTAPVRPTAQQIKDDPLLRDIYLAEKRAYDDDTKDSRTEKLSLFALFHASLHSTSIDRLSDFEDFEQIVEDMDPVTLWALMKKGHTVPRSGAEQFNSQALRATYTSLRQDATESLATFKFRFTMALSALSSAKCSVPTEQEQAADFLANLDPARYAQFNNGLRNSGVFGEAKFPKSLAEAVSMATAYTPPDTAAGANAQLAHGAAFVVTEDKKKKKNRKPKPDGKKAGDAAKRTEDKKTTAPKKDAEKPSEQRKPREARPCPEDRKCPICLNPKAGHWPSDCPVLAKAHQKGVLKGLVHSCFTEEAGDEEDSDDEMETYAGYVTMAEDIDEPEILPSEDEDDVSVPALVEEFDDVEEAASDPASPDFLLAIAVLEAHAVLPIPSAAIGAHSPTEELRLRLIQEILLAHRSLDAADSAVTFENVFTATKDKKKVLGATDLLLDNQASVSVVHNRSLLRNIRVARIPIFIVGIGGRLLTTMVGDFYPFGEVYYHPKATANVLSFSRQARNGHTLSWHQSRSCFEWSGRDHTFAFHERSGLYIFDAAPLAAANAPSEHVSLTTVSDNESKYPVRQVAAAKAARRLTQQLGYISDKDLISLLQSGAILNCPITVQDVQRAALIYGPDLASIKGKSTHKKPPLVKIEHVPKPLLAEQTLHVDVMFVEGAPYLISVSDPLDMTMVTPLVSRHNSDLLKAVLEHVAKYQAERFVIRLIASDSESGFLSIADPLREKGLQYDFRAPGSHDGTIERRIRVVKERVRAHLAVLPFQLAASLLKFLVLFCVSRLNIMPCRKRMNAISPREAFTGRKIDFKRDLLEFGAFGQAHVESGITNSMQSRSRDVVVLLPLGTLEGSVKCFCTTTFKTIVRSRLQLAPMPSYIIDIMNRFAASQKSKVPNDPAFQLHGADVVALPEEEPAAIVAPPERLAVPTAEPEPVEAAALPVEAPAPPAEVSAAPVPDSAPAPDVPAAPATVPVVPPPQSRPRGDRSRASPSAGRGVSPVATARPSRLRQNPRRNRLYPVAAARLEECAYNITSAKALRNFGNKALRSIVAEVLQIDDKGVFEPVMCKSLTRAQMKAIIRSSLFLKEKYLPSGEFEKLKARLVAGGHMQDRSVYGAEDVTSPTIATSAAMMVAALAAKERRHVVTVDIAGAYLNAPMRDKEVLMRIEPLIAGILAKFRPRFRDYINPDGSMVVRLLKALYGCVESARLWYEHLSATLAKLGFKVNLKDRCVFNRGDGKDQCTIGVHVDDLMITSADPAAIETVLSGLESEYKTLTVHRGQIHNYLGMLFDFSIEGCVRISMPNYVNEVLELYQVEKKKTSTPAQEDLFELRDSSPQLDSEQKEAFHSRVAKLLWLAKRCRPDIITPISFLATRVSLPTDFDWKKLDRVLTYLSCTVEYGIVLEPDDDDLCVRVYTDASYGVHPDAKGHTGIVIALGKGPVFVKSAKQKLVAKSSTEAELIALSDCVSQAVWTRDFLVEQGYQMGPVEIFQDNKSTITLAERGHSTSDRTRHISIRYFFVHDRIATGEVKITYKPTAEMLADIMTKPLQGELFRTLRARLLNWR